jgi:hypothetical protein
MSEIFNQDFINFIIAMTVLMIGNAVSGIAKALKSGTFDWKTLLNGVEGYLFWAVSAALTVAGFQIYGGSFQVIIGEATFTLLEAIEYAKKAVYLYWGAKAIENFIEYGNIQKEVTPVDETVDYNENLEEEELTELEDEEIKG